jgi:putative glutamine amidotransferase
MHLPVDNGPFIGITTKKGDPAREDAHLSRYTEALRAAGGAPRVLAPDACDGPPYRLDPHIRGLMLSGGGDLHPRHYAQSPKGTDMSSVDEARDEMELALVREALSADLPVLGICRGIQVLNVAMGGMLLQHVEGHRQSFPSESARHAVRIAPRSLLAQVLGCSGDLQTNSRHHQAINAHGLAQRLRASAWSLPDADVIEAVESPEHRWVLGVQWHPERLEEVPEVHQRLFAALVAAARRDA